MKKALDFIEKHVQWVALGLGGAYLLWIVWTYLLGSPLKVSGVGPEPLGPGEIDRYILNNSADALQRKMEDSSAPQVPSIEFVPQVVDALAFRRQPAGEFAAGNIFASRPANLKLPDEASPDFGPIRLVNKLPEAPAAKILGIVSGQSNVMVPDPQSLPDPASTIRPAAGGGGRGMGPGAMGPGGMGPGSMGPGMGGMQVGPGMGGPGFSGSAKGPTGPAKPVSVQATDKTWVTVMYEIDVRRLAENFRRADVPPNLQQTAVLQVQLMRQEQKPDGTWTEWTSVAPLITQRMLPMPGMSATTNEKMLFVQWAKNNAATILQPAFYQWVRGDVWRLPDVREAMAGNSAKAAVAEEEFDPKKYLRASPAQLAELTPAQQAQVRREQERAQRQQERQQQAAQQRRSGAGGAGGAGGMGPGMGGSRRGPMGGQGGNRRAGGAGRTTPGAMGPGTGGPGMGGPGMMGPGMGGPGMGGMQVGPSNPGAAGAGSMGPGMMRPGMGGPGMGGPGMMRPGGNSRYPLPAGEFDVTSIANLVGWAHDEHVEPGKTYRYRVVYSIRSPVFNTSNATNPPTLAETLALVSPPSPDSDPVLVPSLTRFFIAGNWANSAGTVRFEVFAWNEGAFKSKVFTAAPGDTIGTVAGKVDYVTGWTLVDIRSEARGGNTEGYVLLMDPNGNLVRRTANQDRDDPEWKEIKKRIETAPTGRPDPLAGARPGGGPSGMAR